MGLPRLRRRPERHRGIVDVARRPERPMTTLIAAAWFAVVVAGGLVLPPRPGRVRSLVEHHRAPPGDRTTTEDRRTPRTAYPDDRSGRPTLAPVPVLGGSARRAALHGSTAGVSTPTRLAVRPRRRWAVLGGSAAVALIVWPPLVLAVVGVPMLWSRGRGLRRDRDLVRAVVDGLPDTVDLVALAVTAGLTVPLVVRAVAERAPPPFADAFTAVVERADHGERWA